MIQVTNDRRKDDAFVTKVPLGDFIPTTILERLSNIGDSGYMSKSPEAEEAENIIASLWKTAYADPANAPLVIFTPAPETDRNDEAAEEKNEVVSEDKAEKKESAPDDKKETVADGKEKPAPKDKKS